MLLLMFFFFNDTATTEIYTLSLHDALPIFQVGEAPPRVHGEETVRDAGQDRVALGLGEHRGRGLGAGADRKSTRLNSSHANISYAVFCLKKKNKRHRM